MIDSLKQEFDKGMPVSTYIKKKYGFNSIEKFEEYIRLLKEKADKYDTLQKNK